MGSQELSQYIARASPPPAGFCYAQLQPVVRCRKVNLGGDFIEVCAPFKPSTAVGRLLAKRGEGGYMIIMQATDAAARRDHYIRQHHGDTSGIIFSHEHSDAVGPRGGNGGAGVCVQYHPRGIPGGMMPELDSHAPTAEHPDPVGEECSPWHACGPVYAGEDGYAAKMMAPGGGCDLRLLKVVCRLGPEDGSAGMAARRWKGLFGVEIGKVGSDGELAFTNSRMRFVPGVQGTTGGLESITVCVRGWKRLEGIMTRAKEAGVWDEAGFISMIGVKWYLELFHEGQDSGLANERGTQLLEGRTQRNASNTLWAKLP